MKFIGIVLGKSSFVAAFPQEEGYCTMTFKNDKKVIESSLEQLDSQERQCVLEATGNYGALLLHRLTQRQTYDACSEPKPTRQKIAREKCSSPGSRPLILLKKR